MSIPGYLYNKKGFVVSSNSSYDAAYLVNTQPHSLGQQVIINLYAKEKDDTDYSFKYKICPLIPYRIMTLPKTPKGFLILNTICRNTGAESHFSLFNPGMSFSDGAVQNLPINDNHTFTEINLTRPQLEKFVNFSSDDIPFVQQPGKYLNYLDLKIDDTNCGIIVKTTANPYVDIVIISIVSKYRLEIKHSINKSSTKKYFTYSLPLVLKYHINKFGNYSVFNAIPVAWSYGIPVSKVGTGDLFNVEKINLSESTTLTGNHWNYNLLPGKFAHLVTHPEDYWLPMDGGSLVDSSTDGSNLNVTTAYTYFKSSKELWFTKISISNFSNFLDESTTGFRVNDGLSRFFDSYSEHLPIMVDSEYNNGIYLSTCSTSYQEYTKSYIVATKSDFSTSSKKTIHNIHNTNSDAYEDGFIFSFVASDSKYRAYSTGDNDNLLQRFNNSEERINKDQLYSVLGFTEKWIEPGLTYSQLRMCWEHSYGNNMPYLSTISSTENCNISFTRNSVDNQRDNIDHISYITNLNGNALITRIYNKTDVKSLSNTPSVFDRSDYVRIFNSNVPSDDYSVMKLDDSTIQVYKNSNIIIGSSGHFAYNTINGVNPAEGIDILFQIDNCSGVFSTGSWNDNLGGGQKGVKVDPNKTRIDFSFHCDGNKTDFYDSGGIGSWGYWANVTKPSVSLDFYYQNRKISKLNGVSFAKYDTNGNCVLQAGVTLLLDGVKDSGNRTYNDPNFSLTGITAKLVFNTTESISKTVSNITFTPPSPSVTFSFSSTKASSRSVGVNWGKTSELSKLNNVTLHQIVDGREFISPLGNSSGKFKDIINNTPPASGTLYFSINECIKGSYFFVTWEEEINGRTFKKSSQIISYVGDHRNFLKSPFPKIYIDNVDKTDTIFYQDYIHLAPGSGHIDAKVSFSIDHEDFTVQNRPQDNVPNDYKRYPVIQSVYLYAVEKPSDGWPAIDGSTSYEIVPSVNAPISYTNCAQAFYNKLMTKVKYTASKSYGGTTINIPSDNLTVPISGNGRYQLFLVVKDEYSRYSISHITSTSAYFAGTYNVERTYRVQFVGGANG